MTVDIASLVSDNLDIWTSAVERKSGAGRGGGKRISLYGIERLRPLIVDLAVRGKLTSQQPDEEPAAVALTRLARARRRKIEAGDARKPKALSPLSMNLPTLPEGWEWTQLGTLAEISPSNRADDQVDASFVPMALVSTRTDGVHETETRNWGEIKKGFTHFADGDIGLAKITPCFENGKAAVFDNLVNGIGAGTTELHVARPWSNDVNRRYLLLTMKTASYLHQGEAGMTGTAGQKRVTRTFFESSPLPLPPLAEQQRIVAKVDELMALCDALEAESAAAMAAHQTLVEALLATLTDSIDASDLASNWSRPEVHFDILFTTEGSVDALKQTILELAVRGSLVMQDPQSESVLPKYSKLPTDDRLPKNWRILNFGKFCDIQGGNQPPKSDFLASPKEGYIRLIQIRDLGERPVPTYIPVGSTNRFCKVGEILIGRYGASVGKVFWANDGAYNVALAKFIWPEDALTAEFAFLLLKSSYFQTRLANASRSAQAGFNKGDLASIDFPLPPVPEQERIVATFHNIIGMCDSLKVDIFGIDATRVFLADAIVERAAA